MERLNRRRFFEAAALAAASGATGKAQSEQTARQRWVELAERLKPRLRETDKAPVSIVRPVADSRSFLRWRMEHMTPAGALRERLMRAGDTVILDFGAHMTGRVSFSITGEGRGIDAPARIKLTLGEVPAEVAEPLDPYTGSLSRAWLQDEVINIGVLPNTIHLPRRYAFQYAKIDVIATSPNFSVRFDDVKATALTSAGENQRPLPAGVSEVTRRIDAVSLNTLRDCMQTVFEDGPKRDRRLWIGDLRLQALTNYATFRNFDLVKRCLYLFAGLPREDGFVSACVFEDPKPQRGHEFIIDYAALYGAAVLDYARASNDWGAARELWPVVRRQMEILDPYVGPNGVFAAPKGSWVFVDWSDGLDRTAAMQGILTYSLQQALELARAAGASEEAATYAERAAQLTKAARSSFFDPERHVFVSGPRRQVSWATQAWMVLSGIATQEEGRAALRAMGKMPEAVRPRSPYLYHHVVEAMIKCQLKEEALDLIRSYWGGMVAAGADTFWEIYDPSDPGLSPYGSVLVNSYCHAWSCTPAYLLRTGGLV
jgi:hypothetical protein